MEDFADLRILREGERIILMPSGLWNLASFEKLNSLCLQNTARIDLLSGIKLEIDAVNLKALDTSGAKVLISFLNKLFEKAALPSNKTESITQHIANQLAEVQLKNISPEIKALFELVRDRIIKFNFSPSILEPKPHSFIAHIGILTYKAFKYLNEIFSFLGLVAEGFLRIILKPSLFRTKEIVTQLEEACLKSITVVSLVTFLIGIVVAYLMAIQIEKYGGHIFVVNGVALAMCRELSPIIVAVVMAGRSGSAYTAQIGAMRLNEEVDAISTIGLSPMHVLVLPRIIALVFSMPLLVFIGDLVGIAGGMYIAKTNLGITYVTFIDRLQIALPIKHFVVGMVKAPVFAAVIALIGCRRGLTTEMNARSVGLSTTATVVESIVLVILINAAFAVIFAELGI